MFSLRFSGSKVFINLWRQFRVRTIFRTHGFAGFAVFSFCVLNYYFENAQRVVGCSFIKTCSLKLGSHLRL